MSASGSSSPLSHETSAATGSEEAFAISSPLWSPRHGRRQVLRHPTLRSRGRPSGAAALLAWLCSESFQIALPTARMVGSLVKVRSRWA